MELVGCVLIAARLFCREVTVSRVLCVLVMVFWPLAVMADEYVVPGAEDGYFSAEDYRRLKAGRGDEDGEYRRVIRTPDRIIIIRRQDRPDSETGESRYQIRDTRTGRTHEGVIAVPGD